MSPSTLLLALQGEACLTAMQYLRRYTALVHIVADGLEQNRRRANQARLFFLDNCFD